MIPDWQANRVYLSGLFPARHPQLWEAMTATFEKHHIDCQLSEGTKDIWCRDYLPIQIGKESFVKFRYEPDYLRDGHEHLISGNDICRSISHLGTIEFSEINLDGGNVVASTNKVILTDKVFRENPSTRPQALRRKLQQLFQVEDCLIIPREPYDPIGHADGVLRFLDDTTVLINDYSAIDNNYGHRLRELLKQHRLDYEEIPHFIEKTTRDDVPSAAGCYVNYLRMEGLIVVPTFHAQEDDAAVRKMEVLFTGIPVVPLPCENLAGEGGVLNCCTWTCRPF